MAVGGRCAAVAELSGFVGGAEVVAVSPGVGRSVGVDVVDVVDDEDVGGPGVRDGDCDGEVLGVGAGLSAGRGCGAVGRSSVWPCGHRNRPRPSPATARTEPAARRAARTRRRARTPARSASRCV